MHPTIPRESLPGFTLQRVSKGRAAMRRAFVMGPAGSQPERR